MNRKMKSFFLLFMIIGLVGCSKNQENVEQLKSGTYVSENMKEECTVPYLVISTTNEFTFVYSILASNVLAGTYEIKDNMLKLIAEGEDASQIFIFEISSGKLIFRADKSEKLPDFAKNDIYNGIVFTLKEN